eukprot:CAMPEP_0170077916 /NCGR_PEP_ID=MMETSP0019_2-20121128/14614_1 /TAXON_ID=98059 /ORGANISM="Dinobryon sp., Strain UTEXLB2267" /LENGTH=169 /DNA_ID=CAMNT_0010290485 /DNA_START=10 /DNA_END=519 /DNA_ORIENTATION=-
MYIQLIICIQLGLFAATTISFRRSAISVQKPTARLHSLPTFLDGSNIGIMRSSQIIAVAADYATEIENSVGSEIYGPIFKAGLFIFVSGIVSSLVVAFIVSNSNSWEALEDEFQRGKEAQFIEMMGEPTDPVSENTLESKVTVEVQENGDIKVDKSIDSSATNLKGLDI